MNRNIRLKFHSDNLRDYELRHVSVKVLIRITETNAKRQVIICQRVKGEIRSTFHKEVVKFIPGNSSQSSVL